MKIGINLVGISLGTRDRDWRISKRNIQSKLIDELAKFAETSVYLTTYKNPTVDELLSFYRPKKYNIIGFQNSDMRFTYAKSLFDLMFEDMDVLISTRFDIEFKDEFSISDFVRQKHIDFEKVNFLFRENVIEWPGFVCDNFFVIPRPYINIFGESILQEYLSPTRPSCIDLHSMYLRLRTKIDNQKINFISNVPMLSHENIFYKLNRV